MNAATQKITLQGPTGDIEALYDAPQSDPAAPQSRAIAGIAVIAHPHPLYAGTMDNKVVQTLARACVAAGFEAWRFNFRGVGNSAGSYDEGRGELADMLGVVAHAAPNPSTPVVIAGFSFGAFVASHAVAALQAERDIERVVLVGTATSRFAVAPIAPELHAKTLVVHGESDDTVPLASVLDWARPQSLPITVVPGGGHFFHGQLPLLKTLVLHHLRVTSSSIT